ncbi:ATP-binding protein [Clostridium beijerinckii]|uniref:ATP-binding protein n=1 Tax=Clostridium beijerinckii TaxID=1520 RepID=UPI0003D3795B|nr:ATP-binding protein [Clostridium beijerinckii]ALB46969.1 ATP-binding protein [Clostridium beijerinckii NRRL B-598]
MNVFIPKVKEVSIFKEIAHNIINPLEIIREAISNSFDAEALNIYIDICRNNKGEFLIIIKDDGKGMDIDAIHKFFNLGDSNKNNLGIGEKGLGTKTYYKSDLISVFTKIKNKKVYKAEMVNPWRKLNEGIIPQYTIEEFNEKFEFKSGTMVIMKNYKIDNPEKYFNCETIKDYIQWFTAAGSFKNIFASIPSLYKNIKNMQIAPKVFINDGILNQNEEIIGVHIFAQPQELPDEDINEKIYRRTVNYCRHFGPFHLETNINGEFVSVQVYGEVAGINRRKEISRLKKGETYKGRFGLYLAKDFIPFSRRVDLLNDEQYYHYHILVNSQSFELTADRNNLSNENDPKVKWVLDKTKEIINTKIKPIAQEYYFNLRKKEEEEYAARRKFESINKNLNNLEKLDDILIDCIPITKKPYSEYEVAMWFIALLSNDKTKEFIGAISKVVTYSRIAATDMICLDKKNNNVLVEIEYKLSNLFKHKHPLNTYDYVVCWEVDVDYNKIIEFNHKNIILMTKGEKSIILCDNNKSIEIINIKSVINKILTRDLEQVKKVSI